jgi:hypothetical protein
MGYHVRTEWNIWNLAMYMKQCNFLSRKISATENKPFIVSIEGNIGKSIIKFWVFVFVLAERVSASDLS